MMITSYLTEARHLLGLQSALEEAARLVERGARRRG
jgi:hypothetical protein